MIVDRSDELTALSRRLPHSIFRALRCSVEPSALSRKTPARWSTAIQADVPLYPRGPRSGSGYVVPDHQHLTGPIRPTHGHITTSSHGDLYVMPSLCGSASATRERFRAFTGHSFLACRPLRPRGVQSSLVQNFDADVAFAEFLIGSALPKPRNPFHAGIPCRGFLVHTFATACEVARPPDGSDWTAQPPGAFTSRLSADQSPSPLLDMTTTVTGLLCWRDLHPLEWQLASLH